MNYCFPNVSKKGRKILIFDYLIVFSIFIRKTIIPIKKCSIANLKTFLKPTTFICNIFSHPI